MALRHRTIPACFCTCLWPPFSLRPWDPGAGGDYISSVCFMDTIHSLHSPHHWCLSRMPQRLEAEGSAVNQQMKCVPSGDLHS